jgi:lipopolysaccharide biosynthesis regulator YciM
MSLRHISEFIVCPLPEPPKCYECGFPATVRLIHWYCPTCYAGLNETHSED